MSYDSWKTTPPDDQDPRDERDDEDTDPEPEIEPDDPEDPGVTDDDAPVLTDPVYRIAGPIYQLVGYGETGYFRDLAQAESIIRDCGDDFEAVRLVVRGTRIYDAALTRPFATPRAWSNPVGDVISADDVPAKDRWQIGVRRG